jgi:hypothetical protein
MVSVNLQEGLVCCVAVSGGGAWAVTKYGIFANVVIEAKSSWREMNGS